MTEAQAGGGINSLVAFSLIENVVGQYNMEHCCVAYPIS